MAGTNNVHPVGALALCAAAFAILRAPLWAVPIVVLSLAAAIPSSQRFIIAGADFNFVRALVVVGLARAFMRGEHRWIRWNTIDTLVVAGAIARNIGTPLSRDSFLDIFSAFGLNLELVGCYLIFRASLRDLDAVRSAARGVAWICVAVTPFFLLELATSRNLFSVFGGIPEITEMREGKLRCRGAFSHAILAGCFFAAWIPLWIALALRGAPAAKRDAILGLAASVVVIFCCASSTPLVALMLGFAVWIAFPLRGLLRGIWIAALVAGFATHFLMQQPIWHLLSRIDLVGGSTGYHRYRLIDAAIERFGEWWLFGTNSTAHWGYYLFDVTNQFVWEGIMGGIWAMLALLGVIVVGFASVGRGLRRFRSSAVRRAAAGQSRLVAMLRSDEAVVYGIGACLCAQMAIFLAVSYFGQTVVVWQFCMAAAAGLRQWTTTDQAWPLDARLSSVQPSGRAGESPAAPRAWIRRFVPRGGGVPNPEGRS